MGGPELRKPAYIILACSLIRFCHFQLFLQINLEMDRWHCTVSQHVWLSQEKLIAMDLGRTLLIFGPKCRGIQWYKWYNSQEIEF